MSLTRLPLLVLLALLFLPMVGCTYFQSDNGPPEGTWTCTSEWSHERDGVNVPASVVQQSTCTDSIDNDCDGDVDSADTDCAG